MSRERWPRREIQLGLGELFEDIPVVHETVDRPQLAQKRPVRPDIAESLKNSD